MRRTTPSDTPRICPTIPPDDRGLPDLSFAFYDRMVLFDHIRKTILVVAQAHVGPGADPKAAYETACDRIDELVDRLAAPGPDLGLRDIDTESPVTLEPRSNFTRAEYEAVVRHCQEYIKAGDIFQVVPSQRFAIETTADPFDIYRVLRVVNPSPFLFYLPYGDFCLDRQLAGDPGAGRGRDGDDPAAGGHAAARCRRGRGPRPGRRAAGRPQGAGRAHHAGRPGPQRRRPRGRLSHGRSSPT